MTLIEKIRALAAKANDAACTEEEAASYAAKVQELLVENNLSEDVLNISVRQEKISKTYVRTPYNHMWRFQMAAAIADVYFCKAFKHENIMVNSPIFLWEKSTIYKSQLICSIISSRL